MTKINKLKNYFTAYNVIRKEDFGGLTIEELSNPRFILNVLVDNSISMQGSKIDYLNKGLGILVEDLLKNETSASRVDISVTQFSNEITKIVDWTPISAAPKEFNIEATGTTTRLGAATTYGLESSVERKKYCKGIGSMVHHKGVIIIITDGEAMDSMTEAAAKAKQYEKEYGIQTWVLAIPGANVGNLKGWFDRVLVNKTVDTTEIFRWFSKSFASLSKTELGEKAQLGKLPSDTDFVLVDKIPDNLC